MKKIKYSTKLLGARILSGFLVLGMVLTSCPIPTFAEDGDDLDNQDPVATEDLTTVIDASEYDMSEDGTIIVDFNEEEVDENISSIPEDEELPSDEVIDNEEEPPETSEEVSEEKSEEVSDETSEEVSEETSEEKSEEVTSETEEESEQPSEEEETSEEVIEEEVVEPVYEYVVTLPDDTTMFVTDSLEVTASAKATVTTGDEVSDVNYSLEWTSTDDTNLTSDGNKATVTANSVCNFTIICKMVVDGNVVAEDNMSVSVNAELPLVQFDHYFTEIDESLVQTSDLLVQTDDVSVFTKNTNVVSNFDNVYVISCASVEEARYVYSYYVNKVTNISDMSNVISTATDENPTDVAEMNDLNNGEDAIAQLSEIDITDYSGYIALIDSGADADVNFSVVGDDTGDSTGHGTTMLGYIREENPNAKVMSIKVFNGNSTDAASVYAGIKLAIESKVSIINLSLVGANVQKNQIVADVIQEAINNGITVIGAAGNYNVSAKNFIPGSVEGVVVVGAANADGTKYDSSNYDANVYVVATSTSEATARYTGMITGNYDSTRVFKSINKDDSNKNYTIELSLSEFEQWMLDNGYTYTTETINGIVKRIWSDPDGGFVLAYEYSGWGNTTDEGCRVNEIPDSASGSWTGTAGGTTNNDGSGTITSFSNSDGNLFYALWSEVGQPSIPVCCERKKPGGDISASASAKVLDFGRTINYIASVNNVWTYEDGAKIAINFDLRFSNDNFEPRQWTRCDYVLTSTGFTCQLGASHPGTAANGYIYSCDWTADADIVMRVYVGSSYIDYSLGHITKNGTTEKYQSYPDYSTCQSSAYQTIGEATWTFVAGLVNPDRYCGLKNAIKTGDWGGTVEYTDQRQIYSSDFTVWAWYEVYLNLTKNTANYSAYENDLFKNNDYYNLNGTTFYVDRTAKNGNTFSVGDGRNGVLASPDKLKYNFLGNAGADVNITETAAGTGFKFTGETKHYNLPTQGGQTTNASFDNYPMSDPISLQLVKVSKTTGNSGANGGDGSTKPLQAIYKVVQYELNPTTGNRTGDIVHTWYTHTDENGFIRFNNPSYYLTENNHAGYDIYGDEPTKLNGNPTWGIGEYEIQEYLPPVDENGNTGYAINANKFTVLIIPNSAPGNPVNTSDGHHATEVDTFIYQGTRANENMLKGVHRGDDGLPVAYYYAKTNGSLGSVTTWPNNQHSEALADAKFKYNNGQTTAWGTGDGTIQHLEEETWTKLGLLKVDKNKWNDQLGDSEEIKSQGDATYAGAMYQVFVDPAEVTAVGKTRETYFAVNNPAEDLIKYNGTKQLSLGVEVETIAATDGVNKPYTQTLSKALYPVLVDSSPLYITTNAKGYGETDVMLPWGKGYKLVEYKAPAGYNLNPRTISVDMKYTTEVNGETQIDGFKDFEGTQHNVMYPVNPGSTNNVGDRSEAIDDSPIRYGIEFYKADMNLDHESGDSSFNNVRFAIVNRSANSVIMYNKYTKSGTVDDRTDNGFGTVIDPNYVIINDGQIIDPGKVVAIITSHDHEGKPGYAGIYGLPYGTYEVVELRDDATISVGDIYDGSDALGTSITANVDSSIQGSHNGMKVDTRADYMHSDKYDGSTLKSATSDDYSVKTLTYTLSNNPKSRKSVYSIADDDAANVGVNNTSVIEDYPVRGKLRVTKLDYETMLTGDKPGDPVTNEAGENGNQGVNNMAGIRFAVVNDSDKGVYYKKADQDKFVQDDGVEYAPGTIIDILTLDDMGTAMIEDVPYGTYTIYELRETAADYMTLVGKTYSTLTDEELGKIDDPRAIYANTYYVFADTSQKAGVADYSVDEHTTNDARTDDADGKYWVLPGQEVETELTDAAVRGDLFEMKFDEDGYTMPYVPFVVQLVEADADGNVIRDAEGKANVLEQHVIVGDKQGIVDTTSRNKSFDNVNKLDEYLKPDGSFDEERFGKLFVTDSTGALQPNPEVGDRAASYNIWFGRTSEYFDAGKTTTGTGLVIENNRGSLLYGTYVLQELRASSNKGYATSFADFNIKEDKVLVQPGKVIVNLKIRVASNAEDYETGTKIVTRANNVQITDYMTMTNLKFADYYGYTTEAIVVDSEGNFVRSLGVSDRKEIDMKMLKAWFKTTASYRERPSAETLALVSYDMLENKYGTNDDGEAYDFRGDNNFMKNDIFVDTSDLQPGQSVDLITRVYQKYNGIWIENPIVEHNLKVDPTDLNKYTSMADEQERLLVPELNTKADNEQTRLRVGSLGDYKKVAKDYGNVYTAKEDVEYVDINGSVEQTGHNGTMIATKGYTVANDTVTYANFGNRRAYEFIIRIVDDEGNIVKDINDAICETHQTLYTRPDVTEVRFINRQELSDGTIMTSYYGPTSGSFRFDQLELDKFVLPNTYLNVHFQIEVKDMNNIINKDFIDHNMKVNSGEIEEPEAIRWMQISTTATSEDGLTNIIAANKNATCVDNIKYWNLADPITVRVDLELWLLNEDGTDVEGLVAQKSEIKELVPDGTNMGGETSVSVNFNSLQYETRDLVAFEKIYMIVDGKDVLISDHSNPTDKDQMVRVPKIETKLANVHKGKNYKVVSMVYEDVELTDFVTYTNVKPGSKWVLTATLYDKTTGEIAKDKDGNEIHGTKEFVPTEENGVEPVTIKFKQALTNVEWTDPDEQWVCFEDLNSGEPGHTELVYAFHADIHDNDQTSYKPKFRTKAYGVEDTKQIPADTKQIITDKVGLRNFDKCYEEGDEFTLKISAFDVTDNKPLLDASGNQYTNTKKFLWNGQTEEEIKIEIDSTALEGHKIVFFEDLYFGDSTADEDLVLREHTEDNIEQSIFVPKVRTSAIDTETRNRVLSLERKLIDTIELTAVAPDTDYKLTTTLVDKKTGEFIVDKDGQVVTVETDYHSPKTTENPDYICDGCSYHDEKVYYAVDDTFDVTIDLSNVEGLEGKDIVVYETLIYKDKVFAKHADINDIDQTLEVPKIGTTLVDTVTEDHVAQRRENFTLIDTVAYENLIPGIEYTLEGKLMDKATGEEFKDANGKSVTAKITFTPTEENGKVDVPFKFTAKLTKGQTLVAFETLSFERTVPDVKLVPIAEHNKLDDVEQTVDIPDIHTTFHDTLIEDMFPGYAHVGPEVELIDTVYYENITVGKEYTVVGTIMIKGKNEVLKDDEGNPVTATTTFKADKPTGYVDVKFVVNTQKLNGYPIVAFETLQYKNINLVVHADIDDVDQTLELLPDLHTTLKANTSEDMLIVNHLAQVIGKTKLIDTVEYEHLTIGKEYTVKGTLMDKKTEKPVLDKDGKPYTGSVTFTAEKADGSVDVEFEIDSDLLAGKTVVAFETLEYNKIDIVVHADIDDVDQTVTFPKVQTMATNKDGKKETISHNLTSYKLVDTVSYENLIIGKEYELEGKIAIKGAKNADGSQKFYTVRDDDGNEVVLTYKVKFTPEESSGKVDVEFEINPSLHRNTTLVVFENLTYNDTDVCIHADINDADQSVNIDDDYVNARYIKVKIAKADKLRTYYMLKGAEITVFNADGSIAKDINGNDCIGVTDKDGLVTFEMYQYDWEYFYVMETKAPKGYALCKDQFWIHATDENSKDADGAFQINVNIFDMWLLIPPKTGDNVPVLPLILLAVLFVLGGVGAIFLFTNKSKKIVLANNNTESNTSVEEMAEAETEEESTLESIEVADEIESVFEGEDGTNI